MPNHPTPRTKAPTAPAGSCPGGAPAFDGRRGINRRAIGFSAVRAATAWFVVVLLLGPTSLARAAAAPRTILFFGDSLTAGYGLEDPDTQAYPARIEKKIAAAHLSWRVVNAGLSGETSAGGLHRIDWVLRQPIDLFFLALGGNDGLRGIDPDVTRSNLEAIIAKVRAKYPDARIVVAGMQMPAAMGADYTQRYRAVFPAVAEKTQATLLPFLLAGVAGRPDLNQADGIHPNAAGAALVAATVWPILRPLL